MDLMISTSSKKVCELKFWIVRVCEGPFFVRVQGYRDLPSKSKKLECWLTSPILYCEDSRTLVTTHGTRYLLKGSMDIDQAIIYNYPRVLIDAFNNGFPPNWRRILQHFHKMINELGELMAAPFLSKNLLTDVTEQTSSNYKLSRWNDKLLGSNKNLKAHSCIDNEHENSPENYGNPSTSNKRSLNGSKKLPANEKLCLTVCKTASSTDGALSVSQRGRVIKPRLQAWQGERIAYDLYGNPIAAHSVTTKAPHNPEFSTKLAAICDGIGVHRLESSKQTHRSSLIFESTPKPVKNLKKNEYTVRPNSGSDNDSEESDMNEMTPIPLKMFRHRRIIQSPPDEKKSYKKMQTIKKKQNLKMKTTKQSAPKLTQPMLAIEAPPSPAKALRKKRWVKTETDRLKVALRAAGNPQSEQDWKKIANSISGGERTAEECRDQAIKLRFWKPKADDIDNGAIFGEASINNASNRKSRINNADYFTGRTYKDITLLELDPDDSLLSVLKTPTEPVKFARKPLLLQQVLNETRRSARSGFDESI